MARLIKAADVEIAALTLSIARTVGAICGKTGQVDVVDVHVALCARERHHAALRSIVERPLCTFDRPNIMADRTLGAPGAV